MVERMCVAVPIYRTCTVRAPVCAYEGRAGGGSREVWMNGKSCNCLEKFKDVYIIREALMGSNAK